MPGGACPPVGPVGLSSPLPRYYAPLRLPLCPSRDTSLGARAPIPCLFHAFVVSLPGSCSGPNSQTPPGPWLTRSPLPGVCQGVRWLSHVPALPLCIHAPLLDPGGVLRPRPPAPRTAAFRSRETVGVPLCIALRGILRSTTLPFSGLDHAACILIPSSAVRPLLGVHVDVTSDLLARLWAGRTCTIGSHPRGNNNQLHGMSPNSKVSG